MSEASEIPIPTREDGRLDMQQVVAMYDAPAYVRRAREVEAALEQLVQRARQQRQEWLQVLRVRLGQLRAQAGSWDRLQPWLADAEQLGILEGLEQELSPQLRCPVEETSSARALRRALHEVCESIEHFNRRWMEYVAKLDLAGINSLRADYNRYYVLEKECAVRSSRLARQGFQPLEPVTTTDIAARLPLLPIPRLAR